MDIVKVNLHGTRRDAVYGITRETWTVFVENNAAPDAKLQVKIVSYVREDRLPSKKQAWVAAAFWSNCAGPGCRVPDVPAGMRPATQLEEAPRMPDAELLDALRERMEVLW